MVSRKLNHPLGFIGRNNIFWMSQIYAEWYCKRCHDKQVSGSVAIEMRVNSLPQIEGRKEYDVFVPERDKMKVEKVKVTSTPKTWICLKCASEILEEVQESITFVRNKGPDAFRMFKALERQDGRE